MKTVLIIEDNSEILDNIKEILELANYSVRVAKNGKEGISVCEKIKPDVILCDIMMPEANGYDVLTTLKTNAITKGVPFVFVTASVEKKDIEAALEMGANGYIKKPFDAEELVNVVNSLVKN